MNWPEFHQAAINERNNFVFPVPYERLAEVSEKEVWKVFVDLDKKRRVSVERAIEHFAEKKDWVCESEDDRILIWLRLIFVTESIGFLTLGMPSIGGKHDWTPFDVIQNVHDAADDASLWKWFLIDAWNRCGITQIVKVLRAVELLRHGESAGQKRGTLWNS